MSLHRIVTEIPLSQIFLPGHENICVFLGPIYQVAKQISVYKCTNDHFLRDELPGTLAGFLVIFRVKKSFRPLKCFFVIFSSRGAPSLIFEYWCMHHLKM